MFVDAWHLECHPCGAAIVTNGLDGSIWQISYSGAGVKACRYASRTPRHNFRASKNVNHGLRLAHGRRDRKRPPPGERLGEDMTETFTRWDAAEHVRTHDDARLYLQACAEDDPGDGSLIRAALNDIARSGNMSKLAKDVGMSREGLYKALSENGNPTFATIMRITRALGLQVRITA